MIIAVPVEIPLFMVVVIFIVIERAPGSALVLAVPGHMVIASFFYLHQSGPPQVVLQQLRQLPCQGLVAVCGQGAVNGAGVGDPES